MTTPVITAHRDFIAGLQAWRLWSGLGLRDIRIRYKRTYLGPWWVTLSMTATFVSMGMLFSAVLKNDVHQFLPYLAAGLVAWNLVSSMAEDGPKAFVDAHHLITSVRLPLVIHVLRALVRNGIIFAHNTTAALAAFVFLGGQLNANHLLVLAGLPIALVILFAATLILAMLGARFRDLGPIIGVGIQFGFFLTPIIWSPSDIPLGRKWWITINPLYHLIEILRAPLLGIVPSATSYAVTVGLAAGLLALAYALFLRYRRRIAYWL